MGSFISKALKMGLSLVGIFVDHLFGISADTRLWTRRAVILDRLNLPSEIKKALRGGSTRDEKRVYSEILKRVRIAGADLIYFADDVIAYADERHLNIGYYEVVGMNGINIFRKCSQKEYEDTGIPVPHQPLEVKFSPWFSRDGKLKCVMIYKAFLPLDRRGRMAVDPKEFLGGDFVYLPKKKEPTYWDVNVASLEWKDIESLGFKDPKGLKKILRRILRHTGIPNVGRNQIEAGSYVEPGHIAVSEDIHLDGCALMTTRFANKISRSGDRIQKGDTAMGQCLMSTFKKVMWVFVDEIHTHPGADILFYGQHFISKAHVQPLNKGCHVSFWAHSHNFQATVNLGMSSVLEGVGKAILQDLKERMAELLANPKQTIQGDTRVPLIDMMEKMDVDPEIVRLLTLIRAKGNMLSKFKGLDGTDKKHTWRLAGSGSGHIMPYHHKTMKGLISAKSARWLKRFEGTSFEELNGEIPVVINNPGTLIFTTPEFADKVMYHRLDTADFDDSAHIAKIGEKDEKGFSAALWRFPVRRNGVLRAHVWDDNRKRKWITYPMNVIWGKYNKNEDPYEQAPNSNNVVITDSEEMAKLERGFQKKYLKYKQGKDMSADEIRHIITKAETEQMMFGPWFLIHLASRIILNYHNKNSLEFKSDIAKSLIERLAALSPSDILDWTLGLAELPKGMTKKKLAKDQGLFKSLVRKKLILVPRSMGRINPRALGVWSKKETEEDPKGTRYAKMLFARTFEDEFEIDNQVIQEELQLFKNTIDSQIKDSIEGCSGIIFPGGSEDKDIHEAAWRLAKRVGSIHYQVGHIGREIDKLSLDAEEKQLYWMNQGKTIKTLTSKALGDILPQNGSYRNRRCYTETLGYHMMEYMIHTGHYRYFTHDKWFDMLCFGAIRRRAGTLGALRYAWLGNGDPKYYDRHIDDVLSLPDAAWTQVSTEYGDKEGKTHIVDELRWCNRIAGRTASGDYLTEKDLDEINRFVPKPQKEWTQKVDPISSLAIKEANSFMMDWYNEEFEDKSICSEEQNKEVANVV